MLQMKKVKRNNQSVLIDLIISAVSTIFHQYIEFDLFSLAIAIVLVCDNVSYGLPALLGLACLRLSEVTITL
jgi:hypothetical protein